MDILGYLKNLTSEDVMRYTRIALQWVAAYLVTHGMVSSNSSWVEPAIGFGVGIASLAWTLYGNRLNAKLAEIAKADQVKKVLTDSATAEAVPSDKVQKGPGQ